MNKLLLVLLICTHISINLNSQESRLTGIITDTNGNKLHSRFIVIDPDTEEIVSNTIESFGNDIIDLTLPSKVYKILFDKAQFGASYYEVNNFDLTSDVIDFTFIYDPIVSSNPNKSGSFTKDVVFFEGNDQIQYILDTHDSIPVEEIYLLNTLSGFTNLNGIEKYRFPLTKQGSRYVSEPLLVSSNVDLKRDGKLGNISAFNTQIILPNGSVEYPFIFGGGRVGVIKYSEAEALEITRITDSIYISQHLLHIVNEATLDTFEALEFNKEFKSHLEIVNRLYGDRFDFVNVFYPENQFQLTSVSSHFKTSNDIEGIGLQLSECNSATCDNLASLKGISFFAGLDFSPPITHEVMHQWGNYIDSLFLPTAPGHWGYSSANGTLGGFDRDNLTIIDQHTVSLSGSAIPFGHGDDRKDFSNLELYLIGAIPLSDLNETFISLRNPISIGGGQFMVDEIKEFTKTDIESIYGVRSQSSTDFNSINIVVTTKNVSEATIAFYDYLARFWGNYEPELHEFSFRSFESSAQGLATMETLLPDLQIFDQDMDGFYSDVDCDDNNPEINPDAEEIPNNDIDEDCDGIDLITKTSELYQNLFKIYPIPAKETLVLESEEVLNYSVCLFDMNGKKILDNVETPIMDLSFVSDGLYLLKVTEKISKRFFYKKVIIQK